MRGIVLCGMLLLGSCGMARDWIADTAIEQAKTWVETTGKVKIEALIKDQVGDEFNEWQAAADTDESGDTDLSEWKTFLLTGGGGGAILLYMARRMMGLEQKQSRKRGEQWEAQNATAEKVAALEAAAK